MLSSLRRAAARAAQKNAQAASAAAAAPCTNDAASASAPAPRCFSTNAAAAPLLTPEELEVRRASSAREAVARSAAQAKRAEKLKQRHAAQTQAAQELVAQIHAKAGLASPFAPAAPQPKLSAKEALRAARLAHIDDRAASPSLKAAPFADAQLLQRQRARLHWSAAKHPGPEHYPKAAARGQIMNRSFKGVFAGRHVHFGNMVSHSTRRTPRTWQVNVHKKNILSEVLGKELPLSVSMAAYRTFDKCGGFDRYLLRSAMHKLDYGMTRDLRDALEITLLNSPATAQRLGLQDVLARVQQPAETARLRALEMRRWEAEALAEEPNAAPLPRKHFLTAPRYLYPISATLANGIEVPRRLKPSERAALSDAQRAEQDAKDLAAFEAAEAIALTTAPQVLVFPKPRDERRARREAEDGGPLPANVVSLQQPPHKDTLAPGEVWVGSRPASFKFPFFLPMARKPEPTGAEADAARAKHDALEAEAARAEEAERAEREERLEDEREQDQKKKKKMQLSSKKKRK